MSFMTPCGAYYSIFSTWLKFILIEVVERTYGQPLATTSSRGGRCSRGGSGGRGRGVVVGSVESTKAIEGSV